MALKTCTGTTGQPYVHVQVRLSQAAVVTASGLDVQLVQNFTGASDGTYSISLQATNDLTPNGTFYTVTEYLGTTDNTLTIQVPQTAGPFVITTLVVSAPTASPSPNHVSTLVVDGSPSGVAIDAAGNVAARSFTATSSSPSTPVLPGNNAVATPAGVVTGKDWDWGGFVYNTQAAGAVVDGVTDDTADIGLAIVAGGLVVSPKGTSLFSARLNAAAKTGWELAGAGRDVSTLKAAPNTNANLLQGNSSVTMRDFTVDGNKANQASGNVAIAMAGSKGVTRNVRVLNAFNIGIQAFATTDILIQNNDVESSGGDGIDVRGVRNRIIGNRIDSPGGYGILMEGVAGQIDLTTVVGNIVHASNNIGFAAGASTRTTFVANVADGTVISHGIDIGPSNDTAVVGNMIYNCFGIFSSDSGGRQIWVGNVGRTTTGTSGAGGYGLSLVGAIGGSAYLANNAYVFACNLITNANASAIGLDGIRGEAVIANNAFKNNDVQRGGKSGIELQATNNALGNLLIIGNKCWDDQNVKTQTYGLDISNAGLYHISAIHNDFRGNLTGAIRDLGTANYTHGNLGYNPRGFLVAPAPAATGVILYNPFNCDCVVYINGSGGAALTAIAIGGIAAPVNAAHVGLITGGTLAAATYWYRISALNPQGETLASAETSVVVASGVTGSVMVRWTAVPGATGYNVYGRTTGAELKMVSNVQATTWLDDGSIVPAGALPGGDTTGNTAITGLAAAPANDSVITLHVPWGNGIKVTYTTFVTANWQWQNAA